MKKNNTFRNCMGGLLALALVSSFVPAHGQSADKQYSKDGWKVSTSTNPNHAEKAIDGSSDTRWDSRGAQAPGQWFTLDLSASKSIGTIVYDYTNSPGDGPKAYEVFLSEDGQKWKSVAVSSSPATRGKLEIKLEKPEKARFVKLEQNGSTTGSFWSIHEIEVYKP